MKTWLALFRGVNVGGNNVISMEDLRGALESLGLENVRSYIQSGNVVFGSTEKAATTLAKKITQRIEKTQGFRPQLLLLDRKQMEDAVQSNPFPRATAAPQTLHFFFLAEPVTKIDQNALEGAKTASENYRLVGRVFYLHTPDGIGRSKLAAKAEKYLGVTATARNYRTVEKLLAMMQ